MNNILEQLTELLKKDERLVSQDDILLKNQTQELARKNDPELIKLLLSDKTVKQHFFFEVEKTLIFDKEKFIRFVSNKQFLPDSYTAFKNKIGLTAGDEYVSENKEVVLAWPYKDCVLEGGMTKEDQKRDEIFYNETLAPDDINRLLDAKVFTNFKRIDKKGEHKLDDFKRDEKGTIKDNLIIKGNNLLALASLKKKFAGKVKLIYIDPPYGKDADSFYNDSFKRSTWLTFMKNRLKVAQELLSSDGLIFIQIDEAQFAYLKVLADEIFNKFVTIITTKTRSDYGVAQEDFLYTVTEHILVYANTKPTNYKKYITKQISKDSKFFSQYNQQLINLGTEEKFNEIETGKVGKVSIFRHVGYQIKSIPQGNRNVEYYSANLDLIIRTSNSQGGFLQKIYQEIPEEGLFSVEYVPTKGANKGKLFRYFILNRSTILWAKNLFNNAEELERNVILTNLWDDISWLGIANEGGVKLKNGKKPEALIKRIIETTTRENEIVLDFHLGSGTTCAVAHKMKRQFIGIEQLDYKENDSVIRLKNVINGDQSGVSKSVGWESGGDFVYMELAKWNEEWIEKIEKAKTQKELTKLWDEMKETAFLSYKVDPKTVEANSKDFADLSIANQKKFLIECLDKNQLYVNLSEIEDKEYGVRKEDKELNKNFYESR